MSRFLRSIQKIEGINQKVILQVESCAECPLVKFHEDMCLATCRAFDSNQGNVVDDFVVNYHVETLEILDEIAIPKWCELAEHVGQLDFDSKTYTVFNDKILTSDAITGEELPTYKASELNGKTVSNMQDLLPAIVVANMFTKSGEMTPDEAYEQAYCEYEDVGTTTPARVIKHDKCSLCGDEDESVDRDVNHGICDTCWKVSKDNDERKKQAFINNFRMKRGEKFQLETFKALVTS